MHAAIAKMVIIKTFNANFIKFPTFSKFDKGTRIIKTAQFYTAIKMRNVFMNRYFPRARRAKLKNTADSKMQYFKMKLIAAYLYGKSSFEIILFC